ncbi:scaffold attachment factor B1-like isoform X2 [Heptranchias perlo]|uniref:scaffold attachment factor B1-like isoform X2 n=1 Tax=Heptranchias perlo TaxID=212740 RepID=UPI00355A8E95
MAEESGVTAPAGEGGVRRITELRVVDLKAELKKRNLDINGNKSALMERLRQVIQEEGGNPDEISISPETPNNRTSKRVGKGHRVEDGETEDCAEEDFGGKQEDIEAFVDQVQDTEVTNISGAGDADPAGVEGDMDKALKLMPDLTSVEKEPKGTTEDATEGEPMQVTEETEAILEEAEKENVAENSGEACSSVPTEEEPPEDPQLLMQYMIDMDAYQKEEENSTLTKVQVEDILTLDVDSEMHLDGPKMEMDCQQPAMEKVNTEKMDTTESTSKMESCQQEHEVEEAEAENVEKEPQPGPEECKDNARKPEDEGSDEAAKKEPSIVEGSDQKKSSVEDGKDTKNEANQEKGRPGPRRASDTAGKNLWVSGLSSATRATDLKNLFSKHGKVICAKVVTDARNPGARCYGFITMLTPEEATESISSLNQSELNGQTITVEMAKSEPGCKKRTEQKGANVKKVSKPSSSRRSGNDGDRSRDKSSVNGKRDDRKDSRGDSKKLEDDGRKDRRREKDDGGYRSHSRSRGSERRRSRERRRTRSRSRHRRSHSRDRRRDFVSFEKLIALRERERDRERHWDHKRDFWEMERHREREVWERESRREREGREMLERERDRLQIERMRLERERLEREALERERLLIEGERRREQERIHREREELFREMRYEQTLKRPYDSSFNRDWNTGHSRKMDGFHDRSWQGSMDGGMMSRDHWQGGDRGMSGQSGAGYNMQRGGGGGLQNQGNYMQGGYQQGSMALDNRSNQMMSGLNMSGGNASGGYHRPY